MENENQKDLEEVIQEVENETPQVEEVVEEQPTLDLEKFESKDDNTVAKVDLNKPITNETEESDANDAGVARVNESPEPTQEQEEVQPQAEVQAELSGLEEVTEEEVQDFKEEISDAIDEAEATGSPLPENVQKLINFMDETGGDIHDYVQLNRDVSGLDDQDALLEYYKNTKPHLDTEEINFLMEENFSYDEDLDDTKEIKRK